MLRECFERLRSIVGRRHIEEELDEEIQLHVELGAAEHVRRGMTPEAAARQARREFGNAASMREAYRDRLKLPLMDGLARDVRIGLRSLKRAPVLNFVAVVSVAIGVGLTTLLLSAAFGAILRPPPFDAGHRMMGLAMIAIGNGRAVQLEALDLRDFRERQTTFEALEGYYRGRVSLSDETGNAPQSLPAAYVTAGALDHLGVRPALGRTFQAGEDFTSNIEVAVIGYSLWQARYRGLPSVIGTAIEAEGQIVRIVGVMPAGFRFPFDEDLWLPMAFGLPPDTDRGGGRSFEVFGRLKEGVRRETAQAEARLIARQIGEENPDLFPALSARVFPFSEQLMPPGVAETLILMLGAGVGVLLIAGVNLSNLLLGRSIRRRLEVGIQHALGATRGQIARQFLIESLILAMSGGALGVALVWGGTGFFNRAVSGIVRPYWVDVRIDPPVLSAILMLTLVVAMAAGTLPAWRTSAWLDRSRTNRGSLRSLERNGLGKAASGLVTVQVAVSCLLLVGAGLIVRSMINLRTLDPGYDPERVMTASFVLPESQYSDPDLRSQALLSLLERAERHPGIVRAALVRREPGTGRTFTWTFTVEGSTYDSPGERPVADGLPVTHGYFDAMGIPILAGRDFLAEESRFRAPPVVIVNETLASRHLGSDPIGRRIRIADDEPWFTVVGVVGDSFIGSATGGIGLRDNPDEQIYLSWGIRSYTNATLLLRTVADPAAFVPEARSLMQEVFPDVGLFAAGSLADAIDRSTWAFPLFGGLFSAFGGAALFMSVVGLYGVVSFSVGQRRRELVLRIILGAGPGRVVWTTLRTALLQVGLGVLLGVSATLAIVRLPFFQAMLFGVTGAEPRFYGGVVLVLVTTVLLAAFAAPARLLARPDPGDLLRKTSG